MKIHWQFGLFVLIFFLGIFARDLYASEATSVNSFSTERTMPEFFEALISTPAGSSKELPSPADWIREDQIRVYSDKILVDLSDFDYRIQWATFTNTNSMDPLIDEGANAIEFVPKNEEDIHVGDIVSYRSEYTSGAVIHRVVGKGEDELGTYFIMKGDNNPDQDPGRIRFEQMERVLIAVLY